MSIWIKICGNTSLEDALLAADAGADALGFVFAASSRQVTVKQVSAIVPHLPGKIEKIGVFVDSPMEALETAIDTCGLTGVQIHFGADPELPAKLRRRYGSKLRILRVLHFGADTGEKAASVAEDENIDALLVDSRTATAVGGTGIAYDWNAAATQFQGSKLSTRLVIAGGLTRENVSEAIHILKPWGVDVVSGVEAAPGRKDPAKLRAFIESARNTHSRS
jgi:phosphoribosylanthranilate isomerase